MTYHCHNRPPFQEELLVQDGWTADGRRRMVTIPFVMARDCQYDLRVSDSRCAGCRHQGELHATPD